MNGQHDLNTNRYPANTVARKYNACCSSEESPVSIVCVVITIAIIPAITVTMPGTAFIMTFGKNLPSTLFLLGSSASIPDGIPIVTPPSSVRCLGSNGRIDGTIRNNSAISKLYPVFTRNNDADLSRLFMERLPSATTFGIDAKLLSRSTRLLTFFAASEPEAIAIEQSDSFNASTSLTPSPVIATVCPFAFRAFTSNNF